MKYSFLPGILVVILFSCNSGPFVNTKLQVEKAGDCSQATGDIKMESNIMGERYVFDHCLEEGFDKKDLSLIRSGDTLVTVFPTIKDKSKAVLYKLTLDVDANPKYHYIKIGERVVEVVSMN